MHSHFDFDISPISALPEKRPMAFTILNIFSFEEACPESCCALHFPGGPTQNHHADGPILCPTSCWPWTAKSPSPISRRLAPRPPFLLLLPTIPPLLLLSSPFPGRRSPERGYALSGSALATARRHASAKKKARAIHSKPKRKKLRGHCLLILQKSAAERG
jgi:hypothetical protein